jgi:hypothetical protein
MGNNSRRRRHASPGKELAPPPRRGRSSHAPLPWGLKGAAPAPARGREGARAAAAWATARAHAGHRGSRACPRRQQSSSRARLRRPLGLPRAKEGAAVGCLVARFEEGAPSGGVRAWIGWSSRRESGMGKRRKGKRTNRYLCNQWQVCNFMT